jgi:LPS export ABC transporter protein LptC
VLASVLALGSNAALAADTDRNSALRLGGMTFIDTRNGQNELVLEAERVFLPASSNVAQLEVVKVRMQNPRGVRQSFEMTCERGDLALSSADFVAEGRVQGTTGDGRRFFTTWVRYDSDRGLVSTDAPVRILDGGRTMRGRGFRYHLDDGRFTLSGATLTEE